MKIALFVHSLLSDWNQGNAHFLRGVANELISRGHGVHAYEPRDSRSLANLLADRGQKALDGFHAAYPALASHRYDPRSLDLDRELDGVDLVIVHENNDHELVRRLGQHRRRGGSYRLYFHDTHHRSVTAPETLSAYDLSSYDGVLAFGRVLRDLYLERGWASRAWTWHEAADTRLFRPSEEGEQERDGDLIWIGNWGDGERTAELHELLIDPVRELGLKARVHGVRYPEEAKRSLAGAGIEYAGWLPNYEVPRAFARFAATFHLPRRPYVRALAGIPTIRPFEALACGIPMISAPWDDAEGLFTPGKDYLVAQNGTQMKRLLRDVLNDRALARSLAAAGRRTVLDRHTCAHRVDELLAIDRQLRGAPPMQARLRVPMGVGML